MDSKNPLRDEQVSPGDIYQNTLLPAAPSADQDVQHVSRPAEKAFAYRSAEMREVAASAASMPGVQHTRAVVYAIAAVSPPETPSALSDNPPVIVPVLSAQPITQPLPRGEHPAFDARASYWPDDGDAFSDDDAPDLEPDTEPDGEPELEIPDTLFNPAFSQDDGFTLRERNWVGWRQARRTALMLLSLALALAVAVFGAAVAASYALHASDHLTITPANPTVSSYSNGVVVQPGAEVSAPTPEAPKFQIGAWLSNNAPSGGSVKVFVRLSQDVEPIPQIPVTLSVRMTGSAVVVLGPTNTNAYGLVAFTVKFGGVTRKPIFVTASATVGGQDLTAETSFVPV